jgi:hypothetical protein
MENKELDVNINPTTGEIIIDPVMDELEEMEILGIEEFDRAEWVCQFDDENPVVIAWSNDKTEPGELSFVLKARSDSSLIFQSEDGQKTFRLFARRMSDDRRAELDQHEETERKLREENNL